MLIPLGILAAAGGVPAALPTYELISTTLLSSSTPSITFNVSTFASEYKHLQIRYTVRADNPISSNNLGLRFNGDAGTNYAYRGMEAGYAGSTIISGAGTSSSKALVGVSAGNTTSGGVYGAGVIDLVDVFSNSKNKTIRSFSGNHSNDPVISFRSGLWMSTAPVTSITLDSWITANLVAGTRVSIYGIRG